jgi:hypothetical protein
MSDPRREPTGATGLWRGILRIEMEGSVDSEARQVVLERHGLTESPNGFEVTLRGLQKGLERARALRAQGEEEATRMLLLDASHPVRTQYVLNIQIEAFHEEVWCSGI